MTYILRCATKEARPTEPSASLAEVQRTEKDKRTFSLHCSFLTPLLYNEEKASVEVPRRREEDLGKQQNADKSKQRGLWFGGASSLVTFLHQENKTVRPLVTPPNTAAPPVLRTLPGPTADSAASTQSEGSTWKSAILRSNP